MAKRVLTVAQELEVVRLRSAPNLKSIEEIARTIPCSPHLVRNALRKHGVGEPGTKLFKQKLGPQQLAFAGARLRLEGESLHTMGKQFGVAPETLRKHLVDSGSVPGDHPAVCGRRKEYIPPEQLRDVPNPLMARLAKFPLPLPPGALAA